MLRSIGKLSKGCVGPLWRRNLEADLTAEPDSFCALVVIVNTLNVTVTVGLRLENVEQWPEAQILEKV